MVSFPKVIAWWVTKLLSPFLLSPSLFPGIFIQLLSFFYSAPVWRWMGASSVSGSHHCWIRISWLCWNTEVVPKGKPVLCRAWLHKTLRARVSRDKLSTVCLVTDVQLLPTSSRELLHRDKELPPNKQHFSFHPLQLNTCFHPNPEAPPLLSWIVSVHQHPKDIAVVLVVHLCFRSKSIFFLHVIMQECTALGNDK